MTKCYNLVSGRRMRVTRLDDCNRLVYGADSQAVAKGFVSVGLTSNSTETEAVEVTDADGEVIVIKPAEQKFSSFTAEIVFRLVDPELFNIITGQKLYKNFLGEVIGLAVNSKIKAKPFALELWAGVKSDDACDDPTAAVNLGYFLLPAVRGGNIGDITIEAGSINFTITNAQSLDGNRWGVGPYDVIRGGSSTNEVQTVTITGTPTGGSFTLTYAGQTTGSIAYNATAAIVKTALEALSNIGAGDVTVTGGPGPATPYVVTFTDDLAGQNVVQMTATSALTGGTTPAVAVTTTTAGVPPAAGKLPTALDKDDHFLQIIVDLDAPDVTCGARPLLNTGVLSLTSIAGVVTGNSVAFTPTPADISAPSYYEFGDGEFAYLAAGSLAATSHVYEEPGVYTVKATTNNKVVSTTVTIV